MQFLNVNLSNFDKYFQNNKSLADFNSIITQSSVNGTFESTLKLVGIDYTFTGSYYCQTNSSRDYEWSYLLASKQATRIYLFVAGLQPSNSSVSVLVNLTYLANFLDPTNPIAHAGKFILMEDPNHLVPCKPTSRNFSVLLQHTTYETVTTLYHYLLRLMENEFTFSIAFPDQRGIHCISIQLL